MKNLNHISLIFVLIIFVNCIQDDIPIFTGTPKSDVLIIDADTVWGDENQEISLESEVLVKSGATLTILPGTTIKRALNNRIIVEGQIIAEGEADNPILFTSHINDMGSDFPVSGRYGCIELSQNSGLSTTFKNCIFEYAYFCIDSKRPLLVNNCIFRDFNLGIFCQNEDVQIINCEFYTSEELPIFRKDTIWNSIRLENTTSANISGCFFNGFGETNIALYNAMETSIHNSYIGFFLIVGVYCLNSSPVITNSTFAMMQYDYYEPGNYNYFCAMDINYNSYPTVSNCDFTKSILSPAVKIYGSAGADIVDSNFYDNDSYAIAGPANISGCYIAHNNGSSEVDMSSGQAENSSIGFSSESEPVQLLEVSSILNPRETAIENIGCDF